VISRALAAHAWKNLPILEPVPDEVAFAVQLSGDLGNGERSCLAIAIPRNGWIATDDLKARLVAKQHAIGLTGTIGALQDAINHHIVEIDEANRLLKKMIAAGYRSPVMDLGEI